MTDISNLRIISFEGVDGSGKTTMSRLFCEYLDRIEYKYPICKQSFPTQHARDRLKTFDSLIKSDQILVSNVFLDDYCDFIEERNYWLYHLFVFDRCPLSTLVYQTESDPKIRNYIFSQVQKIRMPDVVVYLKVSKDIAEDRIAARGVPKDELESRDLQLYIDRYDSEINNIASKTYIIDQTNLKFNNQDFSIYDEHFENILKLLEQ